MADSRGRHTTDPLILRNESDLLVSAAEIAGSIENFVSTPEGALRSIEGPLPYVPRDSSDAFSSEYGKMHGVYHTTLRSGSIDLLLLHTGEYVYRHRGWLPGNPWEKIIGPADALITMDLVDTDSPQFPTQFESTPKGVVIVPQQGRAVFYNGEMACSLGYDSVPPAILGEGPQTTAPETASTHNASGYAVSRSSKGFTINADFGYGRLGTVRNRPVADIPGVLLSGSYQASYQWLDFFGNLSPLSSRSNEINFVSQECDSDDASPEQVRKQVLWTNITPGPEGTIGRVLSRTKDVRNAGTTDLFLVPGNVGYGTFGAFATLPDNTSTVWPDNVPDNWILARPHDVMPVPTFKLCRLAFGRLWIANTEGDPGVLIPSMIGRYGTFMAHSQIYPDPSGGEITGLWSTQGGLLVFTSSSTFLLVQSDDGKGFRVVTVNATVGCVAPSSLANMPNGEVVWLGREGFYIFNGQAVQLISGHIQRKTNKINWSRAKQACAAFDTHSKEYRCWVPLEGSRRNDACFIFDGSGWRRRLHETLQSVCVTKDHRRYMIGAGQAPEAPVPLSTDGKVTNHQGVWVLDRSLGSFIPESPQATIETSWISWGQSQHRRSGKTVYLAFRESYLGSATIKVYRDWRKTASVYTDTSNATLYTPEDVPPTWATTTFDSDSYWVKSRPYWKRVDISIPSCEVFKIVIQTNHPIEFIGMSIDVEPKAGGFSTRIP